MKYAELVVMETELQKLSIVDNSISFRTGIKILTNLKKVEDILEPVKKLRDDIVNQYRKGKPEFTEKDPDFKICVEKINDLLNEGEDVSFEMIDISELENMQLPMSMITALYPMLREGEANDETR
jgi:hypothetical protein